MEQPHYLTRILEELRAKVEEADINEQLARICREFGDLLPVFKERDALTPEEESRIADLTRQYDEQFERYMKLKGLTSRMWIEPVP